MVTHLPNVLTVMRVVLIPVLAALFFVPTPEAAWITAAVFVIAAATDYLDGYLARRWQTTSVFGTLLDPIADKMLVAATLFLLVGFDRLPGVHALAALIILLREILISGLREYLAGMKSAGALPVSALAKWKTAVQMVALALLIVAPASPAWLPALLAGTIGIWIAAALTVITGTDYVIKAVRLVAGAAARRRSDKEAEPAAR